MLLFVSDAEHDPDFVGEEDLDPEGPSLDDLERFGDPFVTCPECGSLVADEAELCQACGHVMGDPVDGKSFPLWVILGGIGLIFGLMIWLTR